MSNDISNLGASLEHLPTDEWLCPDLASAVTDMYGPGLSEAGLHALVEKGLAESKVIYRCARCPKCQSHQCVVEESCALCQSANLKTISLFHHIPCAGIFEAPDGIDALEVCPKCDSRLGDQKGLVESVGETYLCLECGGRSPEPQLGFICLGCRRSYGFDEVAFHRLWCFRRLAPATELSPLS